MADFLEFHKMARMSRECIVTEKIDGTNGQIFIGEDGEFLVGSRTRWITPDNDNQGFARWAYDHKDELIAGLKHGRHFGEWWGQGIQRNYGLKEKRFWLFNTIRWCPYGQEPKIIPKTHPENPKEEQKIQESLPECCGLVPVLYQGIFNSLEVEKCLLDLLDNGSRAVTGFMKPEGVVIYHVQGNFGMKKTLEGDGHKGQS